MLPLDRCRFTEGLGTRSPSVKSLQKPLSYGTETKNSNKDSMYACLHVW